MEIIRIVVLSLSGILLTYVSVMRLSNPIKNYLKNSGIRLENDASLLNEMRGVATVMLFSGITAFIGVLVDTMSFTSHYVLSIVFIGFLIGRLISIKLDGKPSKQIKQGILSEFVLGLANIICLSSIIM